MLLLLLSLLSVPNPSSASTTHTWSDVAAASLVTISSVESINTSLSFVLSLPSQVLFEADIDDDKKLSPSEFEHVITKSPDFITTFHFRI